MEIRRPSLLESSLRRRGRILVSCLGEESRKLSPGAEGTINAIRHPMLTPERLDDRGRLTRTRSWMSLLAT